jgi:magnesium-protoporphyrin O-methyltransferase
MPNASFIERRGQLEAYFDRTAFEAWSRLTSNAPVGRIRATVRAGRDEMRATLLSWLPNEMLGFRVLDAGCGTGMLAVEAAKRGAEVVAIDVAPTLIALARERAPKDLRRGSIDFRVGDMLASSLGRFDYIVAMDSLIHYRAEDTVRALSQLARRAHRGVLFTFAPRTPTLAVMHAVGRLFPRSDRAPAIVPVTEHRIRLLLSDVPELRAWRHSRTRRVARGFYTSQAMELAAA